MSAGRRAWFGPKRVGWGYRPQTWQGWGVVTVVAAVVVALGLLAAH